MVGFGLAGEFLRPLANDRFRGRCTVAIVTTDRPPWAVLECAKRSPYDSLSIIDLRSCRRASGGGSACHMPQLGDQRAGAAKMGHTPDELALPAFHMVPPDPMGPSRDAFTRVSRHIGVHGLDLSAA